jgi:hypothetical protein
MDMFRLDVKGNAPFGWSVNNAVADEIGSCSSDPVSVRIPGTGTAVKSFDNVSGKFVYETFVLVPENQSAVLSLNSNENSAIRIEAKENKFYVIIVT